MCFWKHNTFIWMQFHFIPICSNLGRAGSKWDDVTIFCLIKMSSFYLRQFKKSGYFIFTLCFFLFLEKALLFPICKWNVGALLLLLVLLWEFTTSFFGSKDCLVFVSPSTHRHLSSETLNTKQTNQKRQETTESSIHRRDADTTAFEHEEERMFPWKVFYTILALKKVFILYNSSVEETRFLVVLRCQSAIVFPRRLLSFKDPPQIQRLNFLNIVWWISDYTYPSMSTAAARKYPMLKTQQLRLTRRKERSFKSEAKMWGGEVISWYAWSSSKPRGCNSQRPREPPVAGKNFALFCCCLFTRNTDSWSETWEERGEANVFLPAKIETQPRQSIVASNFWPPPWGHNRPQKCMHER